MSEREKPERDSKSGWLDAGMRSALVAVIGSAVALSLGAFALFGASTALGVAIGGALAPLNLWVFAQVGEAFLSRRGRTAPWVVIALLKLVFLLGGVWLILRSGVASGLALMAGYAALPLGITLGTLFGPKPTDDPAEPDARGTTDETERRSFGDAPREDVLKARPPDAGDSPSDR